jgi:hypothetical protein
MMACWVKWGLALRIPRIFACMGLGSRIVRGIQFRFAAFIRRIMHRLGSFCQLFFNLFFFLFLVPFGAIILCG